VHGSFLVFGLLMVWYGYFLAVQMSATSFPTLGISQSWLYGVLPVTGVLMVLHALSGLLSREPVDMPLIEEPIA
jgi:TRAP-type C4-dicarboxylate transport system permease small subunit